MIRINLLPTKVSKKQETLQQQLVLAGLVLLVTAGACFWLDRGVSAQIKGTQAEIREANEELKHLQAIVGDAKSLEQKKADVDAKLKIIDQLEKNRMDPVHLLDELAKAIPIDKNPQAAIQKKVTLTSLKETGRQIQMDAVAADEDAIANFMTNLSKSGWFQNVVLVSTHTEEKSGFLLRDFSLNCTFTPPSPSGTN